MRPRFGSYVVSVGIHSHSIWAGTVRVWHMLLKSAGPPPEWFPDFLRYLAQMRLNPDGELETLKTAD